MCIKNFEKELVKMRKSEATIKAYTKELKPFFEWLVSKNYTIEDNEALNYLHTLGGLSASSYNLRLAAIKKYCKFYGKKHKGAFTYFHLEEALPNVATVEHKRKALTLSQLRSIKHNYAAMQAHKRSKLSVRNGLILELMASRGLRTIEVTRLTKSDIKEDYILIHGKGAAESEKQDLTIPKELAEALLHYSRNNKSKFIFEDRNGNQLDTSVIRRFTKQVLAKIINDDEELQHYNAHGFRHTLTQLYYEHAEEILNEQPQLAKIQRLLRHKDISVLERNYLGNAGEKKRREDKNRIENQIDAILNYRA